MAFLLQFMLSHYNFFDIAISLLILFISSSIVTFFTSKLNPVMWPVLGIAPQFLVHRSNVYDWITNAAIHARGTFPYNGIKFGRLYGVITINPKNIEYILKTNFSNYPKGKYFQERFSDFLGDGIFNADHDVWKDQRRAATLEMHSTRFGRYSIETIRELVHRKLLVLLEKIMEDDAVVDLQDVFLRFTFDNICSAAFGVDPGCLAIDLPQIAFAKAFEDATELTLFRFIVPPIVWKAMKALNVGTEQRLKSAIRTVHEFAEKTVAVRRTEQFKDRSDLLSRLMEIDAEEGKSRFSDKYLKDFCISFILAGRDTSSVALTWFFWLLDKNPHAEERILEEISTVVGQRSDEESTVLTVEDLNKMEYLQAALSESLRLYPSVPIDFKQALEDDVFPDGTRVKKGARVIYLIYSMARSEAIWGKDCREFRPERWLRDGVFASESQFKYAVFNAGPRLCIGKKFAYLQMKMVAASILSRYHVEVLRDQEVVPKLTTTLYMKHGLKVRLRPREGKSNSRFSKLINPGN